MLYLLLIASTESGGGAVIKNIKLKQNHEAISDNVVVTCSMIYVTEWRFAFGFYFSHGRDESMLTEGRKQSKITISPTRS